MPRFRRREISQEKRDDFVERGMVVAVTIGVVTALLGLMVVAFRLLL